MFFPKFSQKRALYKELNERVFIPEEINILDGGCR